eukprot:366440-Chlamydomonas_euryale.AAC.10
MSEKRLDTVWVCTWLSDVAEPQHCDCFHTSEASEDLCRSCCSHAGTHQVSEPKSYREWT